jgi:mannose-1-phosphate guanylyltransferase
MRDLAAGSLKVETREAESADDLGLSGAHEPGLWGVVLAGGEGERFKALSEKLTGYPCPKQYCTLLGGRSMIQCTLARAELLIPPEKILVVAGRGHRKEICEQLADHPRGNILLQPQNRETAPGILFPLICLAQRDPKAVVVILPSDHFILEEARFMAHVRRAKRLVDKGQDFCILLAVDPEAPETGYGWVEPFREGGRDGLFHVKGFYEKPDRLTAERLYRAACLWNTLVLLARVETLLHMYRSYLPDLYEYFQRIVPLLGTLTEQDALEEAYVGMRAVSISHGILQRNPANLRVLRVTGVLWSDWGSPTRVRETLERIGRLQELAYRLARRGHDPEEVLRKAG